MQNAQPALGTAASLNLTLQWEGGMRGGATAVDRKVYRYDAAGHAYLFQLYANVRSVSPATGSTAGGTRLTIAGEGFSQSRWGLGASSVVVGGAVCDVVDASYSKVVCVTRPAPAALDAVLTAPVKGLHPGSRGVDYTFLAM